MGSGFEVDVRALQALARDLSDATRSMAQARGALANAAHGGTGESSLDGACAEFQSKWSYGLQQLEKTTGVFVTGLDESAKAYQSVEDEIIKLLGGHPGSTSGSGGTGGGQSVASPGPVYTTQPPYRPGTITPTPVTIGPYHSAQQSNPAPTNGGR